MQTRTAQEVAAHILTAAPAGWAPVPCGEGEEPYAHHQQIRRESDGLTLRVGSAGTWGAHKGKCEVSLAWQERGRNRSTPYDFQTPRISVNPDREAGALWRDIERRLIPGAVEASAMLRERWAREDAYTSEQARSLAQWAALVGEAAPRDGASEVHFYAPGNLNGSIRYSSSGVDFTRLSLPRELGLRVLAMIGEERAKGASDAA